MRIIATVCGALIFFAGWASGQNYFDASKWSELGQKDDFARLMYLKGYLRGYSDGDSAMEKIAVVLTKNTPLDSMDSSTKHVVLPQMMRIGEVVGFEKNKDITVQKIEDAVNSFYGDYPRVKLWGDGAGR